MTTMTIRLRNALFAACTAVALGFGATQAAASPAEQAPRGERTCSLSQCSQYCRYQWCTPGFRCYGYCEGGVCYCEYA